MYFLIIGMLFDSHGESKYDMVANWVSLLILFSWNRLKGISSNRLFLFFKLMILLIVAWGSLYIFCKSLPLFGNESNCLMIWKILASLRCWPFLCISKDSFIRSSDRSTFKFLILAQHICRFSCSSSARMRKACNIFLIFIRLLFIYQLLIV